MNPERYIPSTEIRELKSQDDLQTMMSELLQDACQVTGAESALQFLADVYKENRHAGWDPVALVSVVLDAKQDTFMEVEKKKQLRITVGGESMRPYISGEPLGKLEYMLEKTESQVQDYMLPDGWNAYAHSIKDLRTRASQAHAISRHIMKRGSEYASSDNAERMYAVIAAAEPFTSYAKTQEQAADFSEELYHRPNGFRRENELLALLLRADQQANVLNTAGDEKLLEVFNEWQHSGCRLRDI